MNSKQEINELRTNLKDVEKASLDAKRELQELRRQVKDLDTERGKLNKEVNDLQNQLAKDEEKEDEARRKNLGLTQKVVETEASR